MPPVSTKKKQKSLSFEIAGRVPTLKEYITLIEAVGWGGYTNMDPLPQALENTLYCAIALVKRKVIGMGRLVGDGARFIYVQDIMVLPKYQKRGVGTAILDNLMAWIDKNAPRKTYVHLFTHKKTAAFYARYGFKGPAESFYGMSVKKFDKPLQRKKA